MTDNSIEFAQAAIEAFRQAMRSGKSLNAATQTAIDAHHQASRMDDDGNPQNRIWHTLYSLVSYSDHSGFFRDQVFGQAQPGGPISHKISNGIREICERKGYDFTELYRDVCHSINEIAAPAIPFR